MADRIIYGFIYLRSKNFEAMKTIMHILGYEWLSLWRSNMLKVLLIVIAGAGIYGIYFGKFEIDKQKARIAEVKEYELQKFDSLLTWSELDTTIAKNKRKYELAVSPAGVGWTLHFAYAKVNNPGPVSGLCLGQRDLYPSYYRITMTDLARQTNTGDLANPMKLLTGNFDLSYVFIFLFPLLVVSLFYNLFAGEKEGGTLQLLESQPVSLPVILISKGLLRLFIVLSMATVLLLLGFTLQSISIGQNWSIFIQWILVIYTYIVIWTILMGCVVWLKRGSSLSAMIGLGIWLVFTLITPAMINLFVLAKKPLPNRTEMIHVLRNQNDAIWESPKSYVLDQFYADNPEFNDGDSINFYKWYYASFTILDKEASLLNAKFEEQVRDRNEMLEKWEWLAPAALTHETLSHISSTDRYHHLQFLKEVQQYHNELKDLYYTKIFAEKSFSQEDLLSLKATF